MELTKETEQGSGNLDKGATPTKKKRRLRGCLCCVLVLTLLCVSCGLYIHSRITTEPIDVENATPVQAVGWLTMRDLSRESAETREELFQMYVGDATVPDVSRGSGKKLELSDSVKKLASSFLKDRDARIASWSRARVRTPYLRLDYLIAPRDVDEGAARCVVSADVQAGPSLRARLARRRSASSKSRVEKNVQLLIMQWFVSRMRAYDSTPDEKKGRKLESISDEFTRMQTLYNELRGPGGSLSRVQALREFEASVEGWDDMASSVDELAKTLWFKDLLVSVTASRTSGLMKNGASYPPVASEARRDSEEERAAIRTRAKAVCDAVRAYFFDVGK